MEIPNDMKKWRVTEIELNRFIVVRFPIDFYVVGKLTLILGKLELYPFSTGSLIIDKNMPFEKWGEMHQLCTYRRLYGNPTHYKYI